MLLLLPRVATSGLLLLLPGRLLLSSLLHCCASILRVCWMRDAWSYWMRGAAIASLVQQSRLLAPQRMHTHRDNTATQLACRFCMFCS
jgi:hypothetical protein